MDGQTEQKKPDYHYQPKGFWVDTNERGERVLCFRTRQRGKAYVIKKTLKEIEQILAPEAEKIAA